MAAACGNRHHAAARSQAADLNRCGAGRAEISIPKLAAEIVAPGQNRAIGSERQVMATTSSDRDHAAARSEPADLYRRDGAIDSPGQDRPIGFQRQAVAGAAGDRDDVTSRSETADLHKRGSYAKSTVPEFAEDIGAPRQN